MFLNTYSEQRKSFSYALTAEKCQLNILTNLCPIRHNIKTNQNKFPGEHWALNILNCNGMVIHEFMVYRKDNLGGS